MSISFPGESPEYRVACWPCDDTFASTLVFICRAGRERGHEKKHSEGAP